MRGHFLKTTAIFALCLGSAAVISAQTKHEIATGSFVEVLNPKGIITVTSSTDTESHEVSIQTVPAGASVLTEKGSRGLRISVAPGSERVDLEIKAPSDSRLRLETVDGQITVSGSFAEVEAKTDTGTIYADTEVSNLKYKFLWTLSYPRFMSDIAVEPIKEKAAGKYVIEGFTAPAETPVAVALNTEGNGDLDVPARRSLYLRTARGIILLNVPPSQVPNDLLPKKITVAAKAIIQSGDTQLANAIRRSAPDLFREYSSYAPKRDQPVLSEPVQNRLVTSDVKRVTVQVTDINNRAFGGLTRDDFVLSERGVEREIVDIKQSTAPFDLLLILDVSGSVENHVDFIRKAARAFVNTVDRNDRVSIVTFNDDVTTLSGFTADKDALSESLDSFDAGGGTALYDSIAYGLTDSLRAIKSDRTAIVVLSDGDDNRSFLPFDALIGAIEESGALIYPMYVPSSLIAASGDYSAEASVDPLRDRYLTNNLSSKAAEEGETLARVSGGIYFPISRLSELQKAYNDIVVQLRTAYTITFRSGDAIVTGTRAAPKLKVAVKRKDAFVKLGPVSEAVTR